MKVGLFFGSFNPIHNGHLQIAKSILESSDLDKIWLVVTPQNPFKKSRNLLHEFDRLKLVELAIEGEYNLLASDVEFHLEKPSYTIDTLTYLQEKNPSTELVLIMGEDNLKHFHKWKNYEEILNFYAIYVYPRPSIKVENQLKEHPKVTMVNFELMDISASAIRDLIKMGKEINHLVPTKVDKYIQEKGFYLN